MIDKYRMFLILVFSLLVYVAFVIGILTIDGKFKCPNNMVCVDPTKLACFVFDMGADNWKLVRDRAERQYISVDVFKGKAQYNHQKKGADCYEIDKHFTLSDQVVVTVPVEWFRRNK